MSSEPKSLYNSFHQSEFTKKILFSTTGATTAELITTPICTIKTVYQTSNYRTPWIATTAIYRQRGFWGFYSGAYPAIMSQIVSCSSKFTFYHVFKTYRSTKDRDLFNNSLNGMMGGILGSILVHPLDVIKNYRQRHEPFIPDLKSIGPSLLYRGYSQNFVKNIMLYSMLFPLNDYYKTIGLNTILAAISTSLTTTLILQPIDFLKVRRIANKPIFLGWNPMAYYRGLTINFLRVIPHFAITMGVIELCNLHLR